ncbi:hypothetical protein [Stutzerimonas stutzeri]|uniref:hypothetical protein n=1 Tax=Stutzerimonas stutzeri TaxID=316 RepID=UPI00220EA5B1|nr:hypothetical protein [Stutzerimonas stutzeri]UVO18288.1 hypothetical protein KN217_00840 [Stutzerimonas stutzeri]
MRKPFAVDAATAFDYVGQTVLIETKWDEEPASFWQCVTIAGVVLPVDGMKGAPCFLGVELSSATQEASEIYFHNIRTIRVMRHRDRRGSGNVLDRVALPNAARSGAALPARRNGYVPSNGSTGAAHP